MILVLLLVAVAVEDSWERVVGRREREVGKLGMREVGKLVREDVWMWWAVRGRHMRGEESRGVGRGEAMRGVAMSRFI